MDATDEKLIALLKRDPRATNRSLATEVELSEPTVASRIAKLEEAAQLRIMAVLDARVAGFEYTMAFGLRVVDRHPDQAAVEVAAIPEVNGLTLTSGRFEIVGILLAQDRAHLDRLVHQELGAIAGVQDVESFLVLRTHRVASDQGTLAAMAAHPRAHSTRCTLDPLDIGIVDCLQEDGRMSFREVGRRLDAPEATIRSRMRRLESSDSLKLHAVTNVEFTEERQASAWVGLRVRGTSIDTLAQQLAKIDEIGFIGTTLGRFNLIALMVLPTRAGLLDFIFERIAPLRGIQQLETWEVVRSYKHDIRVAPHRD